jgi:ABC-type nitrate/sulfonate/bicarbonate transport system permease component
VLKNATSKSEWTLILAGRLLVGAGLLVFWEYSPELLGVSTFWFSRPSLVYEKAAELLSNGVLIRHVSLTLLETSLGFVLGSAAGLVIGFALALSARATAVLEPFLLVMNAFPKVAMAPLFMIWFGIGLGMKIAVAFSLVVVVMVLSALSGVRAVRKDLVDNAKLLGATYVQILFKIVLPSIGPWLFAGFKISLAFALIGAVLGEFIAAQGGVGYLVEQGMSNFDSSIVFLGLVILLLISLVINACMDFIGRRLGYLDQFGRNFQS